MAAAPQVAPDLSTTCTRRLHVSGPLFCLGATTAVTFTVRGAMKPAGARLGRREALLPLLTLLEIGLVFGSARGTAFVPSSVLNNGELHLDY